MKLAILFGSSSNEHEVSVTSATSIIKNLNKHKYQITPIYLDKNNHFYLWTKPVDTITVLPVGSLPQELEPLANPFSYLKQFDLVWIVIHGKNGEDGTLASIFDFLNIKYLGNKPRASLVTMDKILTKIILEYNHIKTMDFLYFTKYNNEYLYEDTSINLNQMKEVITAKFNYPIYLKPANSGSSIGVFKINNTLELTKKIPEVFALDNRLLVEKSAEGREVECAVLETNHEVITSSVGEIKTSQGYYDFNAKYNSSENNTLIPAPLSQELEAKIQGLAIKAFKVLECHGYSRCDFFIIDDEIYLNEINTIPGFTTISMYPKLFEYSDVPYSELLDKLITEALKG